MKLGESSSLSSFHSIEVDVRRELVVGTIPSLVVLGLWRVPFLAWWSFEFLDLCPGADSTDGEAGQEPAEEEPPTSDECVSFLG